MNRSDLAREFRELARLAGSAPSRRRLLRLAVRAERGDFDDELGWDGISLSALADHLLITEGLLA